MANLRWRGAVLAALGLFAINAGAVAGGTGQATGTLTVMCVVVANPAETHPREFLQVSETRAAAVLVPRTSQASGAGAGAKRGTTIIRTLMW